MRIDMKTNDLFTAVKLCFEFNSTFAN